MTTKIVTFRAENHRQQGRIMERNLRAIQRRHPNARVVSVNASRRSALQWNPCKLDVTMVVEWANATPAVGAAFPSAPYEAPTTVTAGWQPDPLGRYQLRYWDGSTWTAHVSNDGVAGMDDTGEQPVRAGSVGWPPAGSVAGPVPHAGRGLNETPKVPQWFTSLATWQKIAFVGVFWPFIAGWWLWTNPRFTTKTKAFVTAAGVAVIAAMAAFGPSEAPATTPASATRTDVTVTTVTTVAPRNPMTSLNVTCTQLDGMMDQAWDLGNNALADAYESVWGKECRGRM